MRDVQLYRSIVGALSMLKLQSEIDSIHQFMQSPLQSHWKIVKRMLRYFKLWFTSKERLNTESCWLLRCWLGIWSWWSQVYFRFLCFSWHSKKQHTISWSSTEAKYKSLAKSRVEISWIKALLEKLQILCTKTPTIWCDNLNTTLLSTNPVQHARTRFILRMWKDCSRSSCWHTHQSHL